MLQPFLPSGSEAGVTKKHQKFKFEYWVYPQKSYLNMWCFEKVHICIPKIPYLHTPKILHLHTTAYFDLLIVVYM